MRLFTYWLQTLATVVVVVVAASPPPPSQPQPPPPSQPDPPSSPPPAFLMGKPCPEVELAQNFNASAFSGSWYKFGGLPNEQEITNNCTVYDYKYTGSGYEVTESGLNEAGEKQTQRNTFKQITAGVADFVTRVEGLEAHLQVLTTDYSSMACLYTCHTVRETHRVQLAWILSRTKDLDRKKIAECQVLLKDVNVPLRHLEKISHGDECL
ncbi:hypothetical protein O3P69_019284 [Scylla paramamosain]|uniref:Lipocalin/cytosolic fatty-acid binding domain-containing protein n=1 Tax=Scylla paramamosain TaxID=85552 RepID=A0AAW0SW45_SCYPA